MVYIFLFLGLIVALYALARYVSKASVDEVKFLIRVFVVFVFSFVLLYFALSGRVLISIGLLIISSPFFYPYIKKKIQSYKMPPEDD